MKDLPFVNGAVGLNFSYMACSKVTNQNHNTCKWKTMYVTSCSKEIACLIFFFFFSSFSKSVNILPLLKTQTTILMEKLSDILNITSFPFTLQVFITSYFNFILDYVFCLFLSFPLRLRFFSHFLSNIHLYLCMFLFILCLLHSFC